MHTSVHGHEVLSLLLEYPQGVTKEALLALMSERFGANARYHTCSAEGMDAAGLLLFLEGKGKFIPKADGITTEASRICHH